MPIKFVALDNNYVELAQTRGFQAFNMKIEDYKPVRKTYYVSPANSLCFMDGGIDRALSTIVFPGIESTIKNILVKLNIKTTLGRPYLPIGSSIIIDNNSNNTSLIVAPTMLLPQNVSKTQNAYIATMAILYNILVNRMENIDNVDILFTSLCCGYGKMNIEDSMNQILQAINDYETYHPIIINKSIIISEPNLFEQPKYYQNSEWFHIDPSEIELP